MNPRHPLFATVLIALSLALAGCGNKGPLVLAEEPPPLEDPATPEGEVPVDLERRQTLPADQPVGALPDPTATEPLIGTPATTDPMPPAVDPASADDPTDEAEQSEPETPTSGQSFPIDPATVPDSPPDDPPEAGTADDDNG